MSILEDVWLWWKLSDSCYSPSTANIHSFDISIWQMRGEVCVSLSRPRDRRHRAVSRLRQRPSPPSLSLSLALSEAKRFSLSENFQCSSPATAINTTLSDQTTIETMIMAVKEDCGKIGGPQECAGCGKKIHDKYLLKVWRYNGQLGETECWLLTRITFETIIKTDWRKDLYPGAESAVLLAIADCRLTEIYLCICTTVQNMYTLRLQLRSENHKVTRYCCEGPVLHLFVFEL